MVGKAQPNTSIASYCRRAFPLLGSKTAVKKAIADDGPAAQWHTCPPGCPRPVLATAWSWRVPACRIPGTSTWSW
ncbi:MAG: hypothetical protein H6559_21545 [Lewinellaceae bacterium]|nr:hypothetical protein [Lewinellaceae bacterium]